jgi:hypothetical protein
VSGGLRRGCGRPVYRFRHSEKDDIIGDIVWVSMTKKDERAKRAHGLSHTRYNENMNSNYSACQTCTRVA